MFDLFKKISAQKNTKYVTNLRMWLSVTILQRIIKEFDKTDNEFAIRGFSDINIGSVGTIFRIEQHSKSLRSFDYQNVKQTCLNFRTLKTDSQPTEQFDYNASMKDNSLNKSRNDSSNTSD